MDDQTPAATNAPKRPRGSSPLQSQQIRAGAVIAIAIAIGFIVWLSVRGGGNGSSTSTTPATPSAVAVTFSGLKTLTASTNQPIYWVGPSAGKTYEVTQAGNRVYVRYLPAGVSVGVQKPYLTVGTYAMANAYAATDTVAKQTGSVRVHIGGGAVAFYSSGHPTSIYVAYPGVDYQIEVYDPSAALARLLVEAGHVQAVPGGPKPAQTTAATPKAVTLAQLKQIAVASTLPVYWAGARAHDTYELTQSPDGRIYLRYLPAGVSVGATQPYLTIGSYPTTNAYAVTSQVASATASVKVNAPGGAVAFYSNGHPTSVYLAHPGENVQVEVFAPSGSVARGLVTSGQIKPIK